MNHEERIKERVSRIHKKIPILEVLTSYGYTVHEDAEGREQQFSCDLHGDGQDSKPSARVYPDSSSWYCIGVNEPVLTSTGWVRLGDIPSGLVLAGDGNWDYPLGYYPKGKQEVFRVATHEGYSVLATQDHEIQVQGRGWVPVRDISLGDVVVVPKPNVSSFSTELALPPTVQVQDLNKDKYQGQPCLSVPSVWSTALGETLGYLFGDRSNGNSGAVGLTASAEDAQDARRIFGFLQEWSSGRGSEVHCTDVAVVNGKLYTQNRYIFTVENNGFCEFFQRLGLVKQGIPPSERGLPWSVWQAPECGIRGFLRGVFATDGSVFRPADRKGIRVNLYSVSEPFLRDIQLLLLQFGIHSRVHAPSRSQRKDGSLSHPAGYLQLATGADILAFRQRIGIANSRKQSLLDTFKYNPRGSRPFQATVCAIIPQGVQLVADLAMPREHSFVAGGIQVHNCFACGISRDAIRTVQEKEGLSFSQACYQLEERYNLLHPASWDSGDWDSKERFENPEDAIRIEMATTFESEEKQTENLLLYLTQERVLERQLCFRLWELYDQIAWSVHKEVWSETHGKERMAKLRAKVIALGAKALQDTV